MLWLHADGARSYGPLAAELRATLGCATPEGRVALLLHPQPPAPLARLRDSQARHSLEGVWATPTASHRSVLAWRAGSPPVVLKLSLGARVGRTRRTLTERQVACGVVMSRLLDTIPDAHRQQLRFDWFSEPAGAVETGSRSGWLLRRLPASTPAPGASVLVPAFSLTAPRGERVPLLVEWIRRSGLGPEAFVVERLLRSYVDVLAYLLFEQGIQVEGHPQNVLFESDADEAWTGRLVLRDLSDMSVSIALRLAKHRPLPVLEPGWFPRSAPFGIASAVSDHHCQPRQAWLTRGRDTVERYGLAAFVGSINASLARFFPGYDAERVEREYLSLWQERAARFLNVAAPMRETPRGLATDEALACYLQHVDWAALGGGAGARLPKDAEPLRIDRRLRRSARPAYRRLECAWGELFLLDGLPGFFRPAPVGS